MRRLHPNSCHSALLIRAAVICLLTGCTAQQMSASNPFTSSSRVPPPATRTIAPGTAAPYYQGDPMPAAQAAPAVAAPQVAALQSTPPAPVAVAPTAATPTTATPAPSTQPLAYSNERTVAIPNDGGDLRFALPQTQAAPQQLASTPPPAAPPTAAAVVPAGYTQPVVLTAGAEPAVPQPTATDNTNGAWRSPQVANVTQAQFLQAAPAAPGQPMQFAAQPTTPQTAPPSMPVQLRAVSSPDVAATTTAAPAVPQMAATTPPPRMRFPDLLSPSTWFTPQPAEPQNQQLVGYMVPGPNGQMQMVTVEQMHAMYGTGAASTASSSDGFRARGTTTK